MAGGASGAFDGLYQGTNGMADASTAFKAILPYASTYTPGTSSAPQLQAQVTTPAATSADSVPGLTKFAHFVGEVGTETGHLAGEAVGGVIHSTVSMAKGVWNFIPSTVHFGVDAFDVHSQANEANSLLLKQQNLTKQWNSGLISNSEYTTGLKEITTDQTRLQQDIAKNQAAISHDSKAVVQNTIDTATAVITVMTAGFGALGAKAVDPAILPAVDYLAGGTVDTTAVETALGKMAASKTVYDSMAPEAQAAISSATKEVVDNASGNLSATKIARSAAVNLAIKYPLYYSAISSQGTQIYQELATGDYSDAVKQIGLNALIVFGGPLGKGVLEATGAREGLAALTGGIFRQTAYIEEISKILTNGEDPLAIYNAIKDNPEMIKNWSANEATMMKSSGGNPVVAANKTMDGLKAYDGLDPTTMSPQQFAEHTNDWAISQRNFSAEAAKNGLGPVATGRWTTSNKAQLAANFAGVAARGGGKEELYDAWNQMKEAFPNSAMANNANLDLQIKGLIDKYGDNPAELDRAVREIETSWPLKGMSATTIAREGKRGFVPIKPVSIENPFVEGSGKVASNFIEDGKQDFFIKTSQPLPVLSWVGDAITKAGLSPVAANQQVYRVFNANVASRLVDAGIVTKIAGEDPMDSADYLIKSLGNQVKEINEAHSLTKPPITDIRFLPSKDIVKATGLSLAEAKQVKSILIDSMIEVPMAVRSAGDRIADVNLKINPAAGLYARIQGALRFSFNPVFQAKLSYKGEALAQLETGGKFPTIAGTNKILSVFFRDQYDQLDSTVKLMLDKGVFGRGFAGEAADEEAAGYKNIHVDLSQGQKRIAAGLIGKMAEKVGMTAEDFINNFPAEARDATTALFHYDPNASFLNSPLARTLNLAFFPFRFEVKVATYMARALMRTSTATKYAVVTGMLDAHKFLDSPAGQAWYSRNSDVIGLLTYFSPVATLSEIADQLTGVDNLVTGKPAYAGQFGELGGLPFGWIPQLLDSAGLTHFQQPFVNPKTGVIAKDYVPTGSFGAINAAIQDLAGSLFTYPGATVGLPSKTSVDLYAANALDPFGSKQFKTNTPTISPQQASFQHNVQVAQGEIQPQAAPNYAPKQPVNVSPTSQSVTPSSGTKSVKKKKADFTPALLPGQSSLGQL